MSGLRITILCPHLRIAGGVRAILTYADRLARKGHDVELQVPAKSALRAWWRNTGRAAPTFAGDLAARVRWVGRWRAGVTASPMIRRWRRPPLGGAAPAGS